MVIVVLFLVVGLLFYHYSFRSSAISKFFNDSILFFMLFNGIYIVNDPKIMVVKN